MVNKLVSDDSILTPHTGPLRWNIEETYKGQAHFAGTGPRGKTCRECSFWKMISGAALYSNPTFSTSGKALLRPRPCKKFKQLMNGVKGEAVPHQARACKYFEQEDRVPPIEEKRTY